MKSKNVLVYGGGGYIGCILVQDLLNMGHNVHVVDNLRKGGKPLVNFIQHENFSFEFGDIRDEQFVKKTQSSPFIDSIVLLSGIVGLDDCNNNPKETEEVNVGGWKNVAKYHNNIPIVASSTGSVYGVIKGGLCTEETPTNPISLYATTKLEGEKPVLDVGGIVYRYATAGGVSPQMRFNLLPNTLTFEALNNKHLSVYEPENMRTFIDVRDFSRSITFGIENFSSMKYQLYNVGDEYNNWSKGQLVDLISKKTGCSVKYHDNEKDPDARDYSVDFGKIQSEGFRCKYSVEDTIDSLIKTHKIWVD